MEMKTGALTTLCFGQSSVPSLNAERGYQDLEEFPHNTGG